MYPAVGESVLCLSVLGRGSTVLLKSCVSLWTFCPAVASTVDSGVLVPPDSAVAPFVSLQHVRVGLKYLGGSV